MLNGERLEGISVGESAVRSMKSSVCRWLDGRRCMISARPVLEGRRLNVIKCGEGDPSNSSVEDRIVAAEKEKGKITGGAMVGENISCKWQIKTEVIGI